MEGRGGEGRGAEGSWQQSELDKFGTERYQAADISEVTNFPFNIYSSWPKENAAFWGSDRGMKVACIKNYQLFCTRSLIQFCSMQLIYYILALQIKRQNKALGPVKVSSCGTQTLVSLSEKNPSTRVCSHSFPMFTSLNCSVSGVKEEQGEAG